MLDNSCRAGDQRGEGAAITVSKAKIQWERWLGVERKSTVVLISIADEQRTVNHLCVGQLDPGF
jgi:hypothetical protein